MSVASFAGASAWTAVGCFASVRTGIIARLLVLFRSDARKKRPPATSAVTAAAALEIRAIRRIKRARRNSAQARSFSCAPKASDESVRKTSFRSFCLSSVGSLFIFNLLKNKLPEFGANPGQL